MIRIKILIWSLAFFFISCSTTRETPGTTKDPGEEGPHIVLDTMEIMPDDSKISDADAAYQPARDRTWDLLHTMLDLSFDWNASKVIGSATLTLSPLFYPQTELKLDAVDFDIAKVIVDGKETSSYTYDQNQITVSLSQPMTRREKLVVRIDYTAQPKPSRNSEGDAIGGNQGLYFIDPLDTIPGLPRQIWTQGETTSNRKWFPTIDQPNERGTQEIILTVADSFMTLSNGALVSSTKQNNGMRRDHWKLDLPHAPYLAMVAVGKWDKVSDTWRGRPVDYYVDPGYGKDAREIFAHTPEMIDFFSSRLGFDFVWPKYAQIIVKNFVTGAMENTTAVVFGDFIQFHTEDILESGVNDYIVSHELFHHWFGDLVTIESWANLTLNEGFANYAEYLWSEYKYGRGRADVQRIGEVSAYFDQAAYDAHPLIHYYYSDENEMFDAHSYNKGGLVLHMLRDLVGDEAFFASLRLYLQRHAYSSVEADDLRQAFEEITGTDLNWFFNQWFFGKGHPVLDVSHRINDEDGILNLQITQRQDEEGFYPVFRLPLEIGTYYKDGTSEIHEILLNAKSQSFALPVREQPLAVVMDPRDIQLMVVRQDIPPSEYETRLLRVPAMSHRVSAFRVMDVISEDAIEQMLADSSSTIRGLALQYLADQGDADKLYAMSAKETNLDLRFFILQSLTELDPEKAKNLALELLRTTDKTPVIYDALLAVAEADVDEALRQAEKYKDHPSPAIYAAQAALYAKKGSGVPFEYFANEKAKDLQLEYLEDFLSSFAIYLSFQETDTQQRGIDLIRSNHFLSGPYVQYRRYYILNGLAQAYYTIYNATFKEMLKGAMKEIFEAEKDVYLREAMKANFQEIID